MDLSRIQVQSAMRSVGSLDDYYLSLLGKGKDELSEFCLSHVAAMLEDWTQARNAVRAQWPYIAAVGPEMLEDDDEDDMPVECIESFWPVWCNGMPVC